MRLSLVLSAIAFALAALPPSSAQEAQTSPELERAEAIEDIESAYAILAEHHPGMYDPGNPDFPALLASARDKALAFAETAQDHTDHARALMLFSSALADGHARAFVGYSGKGTLWPGFATEWRGTSLVVTEAGDGSPPLGSALTSCDGEDARTLIRRQVFRFRGRPDEAGQWWLLANTLFSRPQLFTDAPPKSCVFHHPDGNSRAYDLEWVEEPEERFWAALEKAKPIPVGMTGPRHGIRLITLSTFSPGPDGQEQYEKLFDDLENPELADARAIVINLRRNGGGSSTWSYNVAKKLWGEAAVDWAMADYFRQTEVWYLADDGNLSHFKTVEKKYRERGLDEIADFGAEMSASIADAQSSGQTFFKKAYGQELLAEASPTDPRRLPPVYVITDGGCASACLDAVDVFTRFPEVKLVGAPTSADSEYLEVRRESLASGRGTVILPTKIWVKRPRASGEVYTPDILVTDLEWTTSVFLDHIERDLMS